MLCFNLSASVKTLQKHSPAHVLVGGLQYMKFVGDTIQPRTQARRSHCKDEKIWAWNVQTQKERCAMNFPLGLSGSREQTLTLTPHLKWLSSLDPTPHPHHITFITGLAIGIKVCQLMWQGREIFFCHR